MLMVSTYLAPSAIEGIGVFAGEFIERGRLMWSLNPKFDIFVHPGELDALPPHMQDFVARYTYPHLEMSGVIILDSDNGRFMNHSLTPNTDFRIFDKGYALVDIHQGEELTCNYHEFDPGFVGFLHDTCPREDRESKTPDQWPAAKALTIKISATRTQPVTKAFNWR